MDLMAEIMPESLGFKEGNKSVHTKRTMMLNDLALAFESVPQSGTPLDYVGAILEDNVLGKPTRSTRQASAKTLASLYGFDPSYPVFRLLRRYWEVDAASRPMIAFLAASARDSLLREMTPFVLGSLLGETVSPEVIKSKLVAIYPGRYQESTALATAQRLASSWTQVGYLTGKTNKKRSRPLVTPVAAAYSMVLGYLCGLRGRLLLDSLWTRFLDRSPSELHELALEASKQGWMNYKAAGAVVEITFPGLLTPIEERAANEQN